MAVVPSVAGRRLDGAALGAAIVRDPDAATVAASVTTAKPAFTTAEAKALGVREKVSEFTTPYQCCQPRVKNIQRAATILDGTILAAGERFSLNDALGERVASRGFVEAPAIAAGELVDSVGGGVSQVATTMYNAAFFAGLALEAHTPHEFYISRYPMGREATVSWRQPDLVFRNDWDAAILMSARAGSNGITVAFYSSKLGRRVETETGQPTNRTEPKTIERSKPDLPAARAGWCNRPVPEASPPATPARCTPPIISRRPRFPLELPSRERHRGGRAAQDRAGAAGEHLHLAPEAPDHYVAAHAHDADDDRGLAACAAHAVARTSRE